MKNIRKQMEDRIEKRDEKHLDPAERTRYVQAVLFTALGLKDPDDILDQAVTIWDILCFCTEYIGFYAVVIGEERLLTLAKAWSREIYSIHYSLPDDHEALGPDRETHEEDWQRVIERIQNGL